MADTLYFNGSSLVKMDLLRAPVSASREVIRFRLKTSAASGALLYSRGTQGDYVALQLRDNRLVYNIDLGKVDKVGNLTTFNNLVLNMLSQVDFSFKCKTLRFI